MSATQNTLIHGAYNFEFVSMLEATSTEDTTWDQINFFDKFSF